jgi:protein ImuB
MLWICLYFPQLPLDSYPDSRAEQAWVIETQHKGQRYVSHANAAARQAGIRPGTSVPTAHSLITPLQVRPRDPRQEQQILDHLACLAYRFTPQVCQQTPDTLLLEVSSCLRLFGGVDALRQQLTTTFNSEPYYWQGALSDTAKAARILARQAVPRSTPGYTPVAALHCCPVTLTDLDTTQQEQLISMGLRTLGEVMALPSSALARRFGSGLVAHLQQIQGQQPDPLRSFKPPRHFMRQLHFDSEASHSQQLLFPIKHLLHNLEAYLGARQLCACSLVLKLEQRHNNTQSLVLQPSKPGYRAAHFVDLIRHQLDRLVLQQPVIGLRLEVCHFSAAEPEAVDLFDAIIPGHNTSASDQLALIDRLRARLGDDQVCSLTLAADHRPEKAWQAIAPSVSRQTGGKHATIPAEPDQVNAAERPVWLLTQPRKLASKKGLPLYGACLQLVRGPERIDTGWWDGETVQRDYFIAQHPNGAKLWIYRNANNNADWFLQGVFG